MDQVSSHCDTKAGELHQGHFNANQYNYLEYLKLVTILFYIKKLNEINSLITILIQLDLQYGHVMPVLKWMCDVECGVEVVM